MSFDETIIHCASPSLCGIKPANLFSMKESCFESGEEKLKSWQKIFSKKERYFVAIRKSDGRILFFVYDKSLLEKICANSSNKAYLLAKGYDFSRGFSAVISELLHRLAVSEDFPHEVGLFLGYPLEDVIGFESGKGAGYSSAGYWKVYGDPLSARVKMNEYKTCSEKCMNWLSAGYSVPAAANLYISSFGGK